MTETRNEPELSNSPTRRQVVTGIAIAIGSLLGSFDIWGKGQQQAMKQAPGAAANQSRTSLRDEMSFHVSPKRIYEALLDSKQFAAFSGMPADIDPKEGGAFSMFGGQIVGRNVELIPDQRIVQAWRPTHWDPGVYSIVRFALKSQTSGTTVVLDHIGFPEGDFDHLEQGWKEHYWDRLMKYLT
ncbi:MAG: SRPBCC family protein [Candidatus Acidiferrum sp.]